MKHTSGLIIILALVLSFFPSAGYAATENNPFVTDLIAGRHTDVGDIKIWNDDQFLYVKIQTVGRWCLMSTHVAVAWDLSGIPQKNGNPIPGRFPYKTTHKCVTSFIYKIPLNKIPPTRPAINCEPAEMYIAVHAVINTGETAWGKGPGFPGKNWATYIVYTVESRGVWANFDGLKTKLKPGDPVEGWDAVAPNLQIQGKGQAIKIMPGEDPFVFAAPNLDPITNNGIDPKGGFSDWIMHEKNKKQPHFYTFTFAEGTSVSYFTLHMLDFGDFNPTESKTHSVSLVAFTAGDQIAHTLSYTSDGGGAPRFSNEYGDLWYSGDAISAKPGQPGNWTWEVSGKGIVKLELQFGSGHDPNIGFDKLCFVPE